jgi:ABC-type lipoprotein release transport system permease subunit
MLFISSSIKTDLKAKLNNEADFIVQKVSSGDRVDLPESWMGDIEDMRGVSSVRGRVYGRYLLKESDDYINVLGVDLFDDEVNKNLKTEVENLDIKTFLSKDQMVISHSLKEFLHKKYFDKYYNFFTPSGEKKKVLFFGSFNKNTPLYESDIALMSEDLAREILGIEDESYSDIEVYVPNDSERDNVGFKLKSLHYDMRVIDKRDLSGDYEKFFSYKSGLFMMLFMLCLLTFMLILYQRFTLANSSEKRDVAIMRMVGWSIKDVLKLKLFESLIIGVFAFLVGIILAFIFVFFFDAPLFRDIFIGFGNIPTLYDFKPHIDLGVVMSSFLFFIIPFVFSLLIPIWRIAITDPMEAMK